MGRFNTLIKFNLWVDEKRVLPLPDFLPALIEKCQRKAWNGSGNCVVLGKDWLLRQGLSNFGHFSSAKPEKVLQEVMNINAFPIAHSTIHHCSKGNFAPSKAKICSSIAFIVFRKWLSALYDIYRWLTVPGPQEYRKVNITLTDKECAQVILLHLFVHNTVNLAFLSTSLTWDRVSEADYGSSKC